MVDKSRDDVFNFGQQVMLRRFGFDGVLWNLDFPPRVHGEDFFLNREAENRTCESLDVPECVLALRSDETAEEPVAVPGLILLESHLGEVPAEMLFPNLLEPANRLRLSTRLTCQRYDVLAVGKVSLLPESDDNDVARIRRFRPCDAGSLSNSLRLSLNPVHRLALQIADGR